VCNTQGCRPDFLLEIKIAVVIIMRFKVIGSLQMTRNLSLCTPIHWQKNFFQFWWKT